MSEASDRLHRRLAAAGSRFETPKQRHDRLRGELAAIGDSIGDRAVLDVLGEPLCVELARERTSILIGYLASGEDQLALVERFHPIDYDKMDKDVQQRMKVLIVMTAAYIASLIDERVPVPEEEP